jgi:hypothetical protein
MLAAAAVARLRRLSGNSRLGVCKVVTVFPLLFRLVEAQNDRNKAIVAV